LTSFEVACYRMTTEDTFVPGYLSLAKGLMVSVLVKT